MLKPPGEEPDQGDRSETDMNNDPLVHQEGGPTIPPGGHREPIEGDVVSDDGEVFPVLGGGPQSFKELSSQPELPTRQDVGIGPWSPPVKDRLEGADLYKQTALCDHNCRNREEVLELGLPLPFDPSQLAILRPERILLHATATIVLAFAKIEHTSPRKIGEEFLRTASKLYSNKVVPAFKAGGGLAEEWGEFQTALDLVFRRASAIFETLSVEGLTLPEKMTERVKRLEEAFTQNRFDELNPLEKAVIHHFKRSAKEFDNVTKAPENMYSERDINIVCLRAQKLFTYDESMLYLNKVISGKIHDWLEETVPRQIPGPGLDPDSYAAVFEGPPAVGITAMMSTLEDRLESGDFGILPPKAALPPRSDIVKFSIETLRPLLAQPHEFGFDVSSYKLLTDQEVHWASRKVLSAIKVFAPKNMFLDRAAPKSGWQKVTEPFKTVSVVFMFTEPSNQVSWSFSKGENTSLFRAVGDLLETTRESYEYLQSALHSANYLVSDGRNLRIDILESEKNLGDIPTVVASLVQLEPGKEGFEMVIREPASLLRLSKYMKLNAKAAFEAELFPEEIDGDIRNHPDFILEIAGWYPLRFVDPRHTDVTYASYSDDKGLRIENEKYFNSVISRDVNKAVFEHLEGEDPLGSDRDKLKGAD